MQRRVLLRGLLVVTAATAAGCTPDRRTAPRASDPPAGRRRAQEPGGREARAPDRPETLARRSADPRPAPATLTVVCRQGWGARPVTGPFREHTIERLTVHHSAVVHTDPDEGAARARQHQRYHQEAGMADLAYHHLVDRDGDVHEGRPVSAAAETFTDHDPTGHYSPCLEGDFDRQTPSEEQLAALVDLLAWAAGTFGVDTATIAGHRAHASTSCPGDALQALIDDGSVRQRVESRLAAGGVRLSRSC